MGAAAATVFAELIVDVVLVVYLGDCFRLRLDPKFLLSLAGALVAMVGVVLICYWFIESLLIRLLFAFFLGGGAFVAVSLFTGNSLISAILGKVKNRIRA